MNTSLFQGDLVNTNRIIYTPSPFAKTSLLHLQEVGKLQAKQPHISRRVNLQSYLFFIVESGSGVLDYNGQTYSLKQGDCAFIDCMQPYAHCSSDDLWALKWVHFYGSNMSDIYEKYLQRGGQNHFTATDPQTYHTLLHDLFTLAGTEDYVKDMKINEKLSSLLTQLMVESWNPDRNHLHSNSRRNLREIQDYLNQNYPRKITLDELADTFYINKFYLTRLFKEQFGMSINTYLLQTRITHAKRLLRFSDLSIEQIGSTCGMDDANYFSRVFKKVEGCTPGEYRRNW